jgi:GDPmannose 4,6-dehydratase
MFGLGNVDSNGKITKTPLNEESLLKPASPYGIAKLYGYWTTRVYRQAYKLFAAQGILFNHESPLRGMEFVTRKISNSVAKISLGLEKELHIGNLASMRDWGYAPEYVEAMWKIVQHDVPDDFVIATGETHTVEEFLYEAFKVVNLDWKEYTKVDKKELRPLDVPFLLGDYSKAEAKLGWKPKTKFKELATLMVKEDVRRWKAYVDGDRFPWDAPSYPSEARILTRALKA